MKKVALGLLVAVLGSPAAMGQPTEQPAVNEKVLAFLKPVEPAEGDSDLKKKLKERHNSAVKLLGERIAEYKKGSRDLSHVFEAAKLAGESKLDLADDAAARVPVLEQIVDIAKLIESRIQDQLELGFGSKADLELARYARLSAEVDLLKARK